MQHIPQQVVLMLTPAERKLICDIATLPAELEQRIKQPPGPGEAQIVLTLDELDELEGHISAVANRTANRRRQRSLDAVLVKAKTLLGERTVTRHQAEPIVIDLSGCSNEPAKLEDKAVAYMNRFVAELERAGVDIEKVLEGLQPVKIGPDDMIAVTLNAAERNLLLGLPDLAGSVIEQISKPPTGKRKREFTLRQINQIESAISKRIALVDDKKALREWHSLDGIFINAQSRYTTDNEPQNSLGRKLADPGGPVSLGAAVRDMMTKMLEERKAAKKKPPGPGTRPLPTTNQGWLRDIAWAYRDAAEAKWFGVLAKGGPIRVDEYFHMAPLVCIKFRGIKADEARRKKIIEGALSSYVATTSRGEGGDYIEGSPLLAFTFCYLAAHFVVDLMDEAAVGRVMDFCLAHEDELAGLAGTKA